MNNLFPSMPNRRMILISLSFIICHLSFSVAHAQVGTWRAYMSYYEPQQIVKGGDLLFVRASNSLYSYNLNDQSITTYDKVTTLNDTQVNLIAWNNTTRKLIIVYANSNIDLMDAEGHVTNISSLYSKSMTQDKTVNSIFINDVYAYLATGFGVVKVNMQRAEIAESYILNRSIVAVGTDGSTLYAKDASGTVMAGSQRDNLIDFHNWAATDTYSDELFAQDQSDWNEYHDLVNTLLPGGPKSNHFGFMTYQNGRLYTSSGGSSAGNIQLLQNGEWTFYQDTDMTAVSGLTSYSNVVAIAIDPNNRDHVFAAARNGLYEFQDGKLISHYDRRNSPIDWYKADRPEYQMVTGVVCDDDNNVWCVNSQSLTHALMKMDMSSKEWTAAELPELMALEMNGHDNSLGNMVNMYFDRQGYLWFINDHYDLDSFWCIDPKTMQIVNSFKTFVNQDGTTIADYRPHCLAEDLEGNIWIGTKVGPFMLEHGNLYTRDTYLTQVKVPRNDGTNFADYLLSGANISCMAVDGGGRKWFGTSGSGVYLISSDNMTQLQNFTTANSPLLSDNIVSITIDNQTGEVFFGTENGLCSYMSDATEAAIEMVKDDVYAYPNPVTSAYNGLISVVGLSMNADVKILTASGQLVAQGRSNGGTFTWDGRDRQGRRVASGVYMVATATSDGKKGVVCKIAVIN